MNRVTLLLIAVLAAICLFVMVPQAVADVGVNVQLGAAPDCPYGYYPDAPYHCAPYGYYGPEWFNDGVFIGVGPWYHGDEHWRGHVDRRFDEHEYHGEYPRRGEHREHDVNRMEGFRGNEMRDGHGRREHEEHEHGER